MLELLQKATSRRGLTTIVILHDLNAATRFADQIVPMLDSRLLRAGSSAEVLTASVLQDAYGVEVCVLSAPDGHRLCSVTARPDRNGFFRRRVC